MIYNFFGTTLRELKDDEVIKEFINLHALDSHFEYTVKYFT